MPVNLNDDREGENIWFGKWVEVRGKYITVELEGESSVICTQLDQHRGSAVTERGKKIARRWSFVNTLNVEDEMLHVVSARAWKSYKRDETEMLCFHVRFAKEVTS